MPAHFISQPEPASLEAIQPGAGRPGACSQPLPAVVKSTRRQGLDHVLRRWPIRMVVVLAFLAPLPAWATTSPGPALSEENPATVVPAYEVSIDAPRELETLLRAHLDLIRFQSSEQAKDLSRAELHRLVVSTASQARSLLETEGYFNPSIQIEESLHTSPPTARIKVQPGPRALIGTVHFAIQGPRQAIAPAEGKVITHLRQDWKLPTGQSFSQDRWSEAKTLTLSQVRAQGYPAARWASTRAMVDTEHNRVDLDLNLETGPLFRLGPIQIEGLSRYPRSSVVALSPFNAGTPYSDKLILDYQDRLRKSGLFESASVEVSDDPTQAEATPVRVTVREAALQQATLGVGVSDTAGARVSLEHMHRNVLGTAWMATNKVEIGQEKRSWVSELTSHPQPGNHRDLLATLVQRENAAGTIVTSSRLRVGQSQDTEDLERILFVEANTTRTRTEGLPKVESVTTNSANRAYSGNIHWLRRKLDNPLLPVDGDTFNAQLAIGYAMGGDVGNNGVFSRLYGRWALYRPLGGSWFLNTRLEAGHVFADSRVGIPDTLLFRAGGDDSVRGYDYRSLGPTEAGVVRSARVMMTGSVEIAHPLSRDLPAWWWAAFVDAGHAADRWSEMQPQWGYGAGLRWRSPVGPVKLDLAYGQALQRWRLHFNVGISF